MIPVTIGLGLINFNLVVNTLFASRFIDPELAPRAIDAAFRIYMLPQGMFSVAVATVLFPRLSRLATRGDMDGFRHTVALGLRQIAFTLIPASVFTAVLATPITRIVYERGAWPDETAVTASALAAFSLGLTFNGAMLMLNRAFFSLQTPWTPTAIALGNLVVNFVLAAALYPVGVWGIPLATSLANMAGAAALLVVFRRRLGRIEFGETARRSCESRSHRRRSRPSPIRSGACSTMRSAGPSAGRSCRSAARSSSASAPTSFPAVCWEFVSRRRCYRCYAAFVAANRLWTKTESGTSRSSRTSTTASRRSPIASSR